MTEFTLSHFMDLVMLIGFRFFLDGQRPYLNFFVEKWTLNTTAKFVGAMFAVFILGVLMEAVVKLRQKVILTARLNHWSASTLQKIVTLLHGCQEMFGFLLMLATMMFSVEFLLSAVLGLALGHALFSKIDGGKDTVHKKNKQYHLDSSSLQEVQDLPEQDAATTPLYPQRCYCNQPSVS